MAGKSHGNSRAVCTAVLLLMYAGIRGLAAAGRLAAAQIQGSEPQNSAVDTAAVAGATNAYEGDAAALEPATDVDMPRQEATVDGAATNSYEGASVFAAVMQPALQAGAASNSADRALTPQAMPAVPVTQAPDAASVGGTVATTAPDMTAASQQPVAAAVVDSQPAAHADTSHPDADEVQHVLGKHELGKQQAQQQGNDVLALQARTAIDGADAAVSNTYEGELVMEFHTSDKTEELLVQKHGQHNLQQQSGVTNSATPKGADAAVTDSHEGLTVVDVQQASLVSPLRMGKAQQQLVLQQQQPAAESTDQALAPTATGSADAVAANLYEGGTVVDISQAADKQQPKQSQAASIATPQTERTAAGQHQQLPQDQGTRQQQVQHELLPDAGAPASTAAAAAEGDLQSNLYEGTTVADPAGAFGTRTQSTEELNTNPLQQQVQQLQLQDSVHTLQSAAGGNTASKSTSNRSQSSSQPKQRATAIEDLQPHVPVREKAASNTYEGDLSELEALALLFKPIYSFDDPRTHATRESGQQQLPKASSRTAGAGSSSITKATAATSIDDMTLGLGPNHPIPGSTQQQQQHEQQPQAQAGAATPASPQAGTGVGPNTPGYFVGGPTLTPQHAGWKSDNPENLDPIAEGVGTYVAASSSAGAVDKNLFDSLNNDLSFFISSHQKRNLRTPQRHLQSSDGQASGANADSFAEATSATADGPANAIPGPLQYPEGSFDLPPAAAQAAQMQVDQLQQVLAAKRVSKVQLEKAIVPELHAGASTIITGGNKAAMAAGQQTSKFNHRKLIDTTAAAAAKIQELTQAGRAGKPLWGVTYSWRRAEACDGARQICRCPHPEELDTDLDLLYRYSHRIRTYAVECPELMRMLLHYTTANPAASWLIGVWVGADAAANQAQIKLLGRLLEEFPHASLAGIAVGNEAVSRGDVKEQELIGLIQQVRSMVHTLAQKTDPSLVQVPIMTVEQPAAFTPQLAAAIDAAGAVIQPFFSGAVDTSQSSWVKSAVSIALQQYSQLQEELKSKQVLVAEIGWPSQSGEVDTNRASLMHAAEFANAWVKAADKAGIPYYYHELADAGWKAALRQSAASAAAAARTLKGRHQQPSILAQGVLGDEHFGLVTADRKSDKGLLPQHKA